MATIAIIGALEKEIMQIKEELSDVCEAREAGLTVVSGGLDGLTVVATTAGMGTVNAAAATQHLISKYAPQAVVFSGIAGGLNPKLHLDDVVIGKRLRYLDTDTALIAESAPGLEEFGSTPALVDIAVDVLAAQRRYRGDACRLCRHGGRGNCPCRNQKWCRLPGAARYQR